MVGKRGGQNSFWDAFPSRIPGKLLYVSDIFYNIFIYYISFFLHSEVFVEASNRLAQHIVHWGYQESREEYVEILKRADVVVSTAKHEFFGVAM